VYSEGLRRPINGTPDDGIPVTALELFGAVLHEMRFASDPALAAAMQAAGVTSVSEVHFLNRT